MNFMLYFIQTVTLYFRTNFSVFYTSFLCCIFVRISPLLQQIDWYTLLIFRPYFFVLPYEFSAVFSPLFFAQIDYHTVYIDRCLYHIFTRNFMNFEMLYP